MPQEMARVKPGEVRLGEPLPFSVYDEKGFLLLREGFVIKMQKHLEVLLQRGLYYDRAKPRAPVPTRRETRQGNIFEMMDLVKIRLNRVFEDYRSGRDSSDFMTRIADFALDIQEACIQDPDAALASVNLDYHSSYIVVHHLQAALLCELVARRKQLSDQERATLVCAALTHDIGLVDIQNELEKQVAPLTEGQRARIGKHPSDGLDRLKALGVGDALWLDAVQHHHERIDGSGYPEGLAGEAVHVPARILGIVDTYCAMVRDRPYRKAKLSREAMRSLLTEQGGRVDNLITQMMIKEVGVFPPGTIVRLANNEVAVVKERQTNSAFPIVYTFINQDGLPILKPLRRDTVPEQYNITGMVPFSEHKGSIAIVRSLWK